VRVAVVGAGVVGLATTAALLDAGAEVTCFEAAGPMSKRSAGASRIFRLAHTEPAFVDAAARSHAVYRQWSAAFGRELVAVAGTVVAGPDVRDWAAAMAAAGAAHEVHDEVDDSLGLPIKAIDGPCLLDPAGGVIDATGVGEYLVAATRAALVADLVYLIEEGPAAVRVCAGSGSASFDAVVIAAGFGTCQLAAQVGLYTPSLLLHHVRFTFPMADVERRPPALIDKSETWRRRFTTYQHLTAPGRWAVGAHVDPAAVAWEVGRDPAVAVSRAQTVDYVRENLDGVQDQPVDEVYCNVVAGWADGYRIVRTARVVAGYGDNLFKLAPVLGRELARAAVDGSLPDSTVTP